MQHKERARTKEEVLKLGSDHLYLVIKIQAKARSYICQRKFRKMLLQFVNDKDNNNNKNSQNGNKEDVSHPYFKTKSKSFLSWLG
jgi:hypothetical protein